jgi:hypothetical protein
VVCRKPGRFSVEFLHDASRALTTCDLVMLSREESRAKAGDKVIYMPQNCR